MMHESLGMGMERIEVLSQAQLMATVDLFLPLVTAVITEAATQLKTHSSAPAHATCMRSGDGGRVCCANNASALACATLVQSYAPPHQGLMGWPACTRRGRGSGENACAASSASAPGCTRPRVSGQARARATAPSTSAAFSCSWPGGSSLSSLRGSRVVTLLTLPKAPGWHLRQAQKLCVD